MTIVIDLKDMLFMAMLFGIFSFCIGLILSAAGYDTAKLVIAGFSAVLISAFCIAVTSIVGAING